MVSHIGAFVKGDIVGKGGKDMFKKAITFSFDDGVVQDKKLVELFNKYGLKGTFNLNSELLGGPLGSKNQHQTIAPSEIRAVYAGHEVAAHTLRHPFLPSLDEQEIIRQVEQDRLNLSDMVGYEVVGMAYPCGGQNNDDRTAAIIKNNTGIRYARALESSHDFKPQENLFRFKSTVYHLNVEQMFELAKQFLELETDEPSVFYVWGHSFELDYDQNGWQTFEELCRLVSGKSDIFYGTNREVLLSDNPHWQYRKEN